MPEIEEIEDRFEENEVDRERVALGESPKSYPIHFEPVVQLPLVEVSLNEDEEDELIKLRAKLYRYDTMDTPAEWKERGTGDVKLLRHKIKNTVRIVMRRDKTLKICANHFVWPWMELNPNCGSDRAWVWSALADFADEQPKPQLLAIKFANAENAKSWKEAFERAKTIVELQCKAYSGMPDSDESGTEVSLPDSEEESQSGINEKKLSTRSVTENKAQCESETKPGSENTEAAEKIITDLAKLSVEEQNY